LKKLVLLPDNSSIDALRDVFSASPIQINWDTLCVEIASSIGNIVADQFAEYRALTGEMNVWYESATNRSNLLLTLIPSPEMVSRHEAIGDAWGRPLFFPFINIAHDPLLRRNRRSFINSVSTRLVEIPIMLTFSNETVISDLATVPSQADFYSDFASRGSVNRLPEFTDYQI